MILQRILIHFIYFLYYSSIFSNSYVLIYHTENSPSTQYYDCIYYTRSEIKNNIQGVKYCRQLNESQPLQRDFNQSCYNGGHLWSFENISLLNVSTARVLQWSSSVEQANNYFKYLSNKSLDIEDKYICNCTNSASFGKFCEYEFYDGSTFFVNAVTKQFLPLQIFSMNDGHMHVGSQLHNNRPCYTTWTCNSGLMCLDWRHICDGKQQCMDGVDEDYCEILEFNECEDDEYRCANGMCIPEEYWLDGDFDCMDFTDEIGVLVNSGNNCFDMPSFVCDEHCCPYNQWSCGDGQCVADVTDRHEGIRSGKKEFCRNMRDINYMCEAATRQSKPWWTIDNGYCLPYSLAYQTLRLDTTTTEDNCSFSVKCALSNSLDQDCECTNTTACRKAVIDWCTDSNMIYPNSGPLLSPSIHMCYKRERDWTKKKPDNVLYKGQVKCIGYQLITTGAWRMQTIETFPYYRYRLLEYRLCKKEEATGGIRNHSGPSYDANCWNNSKTFNNRSFQVSFLCDARCISKYRVRDGVVDCYPSEEVNTVINSCPQIQRHRLQCSSSEQTCLLAGVLGTWSSSCTNKRDEIDRETDTTSVKDIVCTQRTDPGCSYFRNYIQISSSNNTNTTANDDDSTVGDHSPIAIPFRFHCNSFFNTKSGIDESPHFCKKWICSIDEYKCLSGQCIAKSWICDGEWDCNDGSDEQRIFTMNELNEHNSKIINLTEMKHRCHQQYRLNNTPFSNICNISTEYPCFRTDSDDPFNFTRNRPCIDLAQIGDEKTDCLSGLDERNRIECSDRSMLGFHFQLNNNLCIQYLNLCTGSNQWTPGVDIAYDSVCFYQRKRFKNDTISDCNTRNDVMCLNDVCLRGARCNGEIECPHGEDEYRCIPQEKSKLRYRSEKEGQFKTLRLPNHPPLVHSLPENQSEHHLGTEPSLPIILNKITNLQDVVTESQSVDRITTANETNDFTVTSVYEVVRDSLPNGTITFDEHYLPFICNHGIAVKYSTDNTVCFCPPSYYGPQCEFYSDRITVVTHLDLGNYRSSFHQIGVIKILTTFLFKDHVIDYYEFHVHPQLQNDNNYVKQSIYFLYPRIEEFIKMKKNNRSGTQLYSVKFEAFNLYLSGTIEPIGLWEYPIYFDFLPAFRLSKILRFPRSVSSLSSSPCLQNPCGKNGLCQETIKSHRLPYFCFCNSGYYGIHCESYDEECSRYCSPKSICKPKYRGNITGNQHPLCLCPASTFGTSCHLKNDNCQRNPCLHGGICIVTYDPTDINNYICLCTNSFTGYRCQYPKEMVFIAFALSSNSKLRTADVVATTVSFSDYDILSLRLNVRHQQAYNILPSYLKLNYDDKAIADAPTIAIMKVYGPNYHNEESGYYVLYFQSNQGKINITVDLTPENHCPPVQTLWHLLQRNETTEHPDNSTINSTTAVFFYHHVCQEKGKANSTFTCFRDQNYLCICEVDHYRAECFGYNRSIDRCFHCLSNGYCLKGELNAEADFLCLCPRCHHGRMCQYSTEIMSYTLDSLIVKDIQNNYQASFSIYILFVVLIFLFGLFNNLCGFLTFIRPKVRKVGVGKYLLIVSVINQCSLLVLLLKVIHIIFGSNGTLSHYESFNLYSCKTVSYLLSVFTRIGYWLTSLTTIERLCLVLFPTSSIVKDPRLAPGMSIFAILVISGMHVHEVLHYTTLVDLSYTSINVTLCVTNYAQPFVSIYNRVNVLVHYSIPFLIQVISVTVTLIQTTCSRARLSGNRQQTFVDLLKKQFKTQKDYYVTPIIIILSSLPQAILSFSYACTELKQSWQRYTLLSTYFLSYLPQTLGFILYVLPSTTYCEEFRQTVIGKRLLKQQRTPTTNRQDIEITSGGTKRNVLTFLT